MPLLDLSLVTQTLIALIDGTITTSEAWNTSNVLSVEPLPPDKLTGSNTLGLYLYHTVEETSGKHTYVPGVSDVPVRYTPLGLKLYYMLTAHSDLDSGGVFREQLMMGLAMKALHDHPQITDDTAVNGTPIMPALLRGRENAFRIAMLPIRAEDAIGYWTAGSNPQRLAAYYHLAVVKLEPERPAIRAGRVLTYNVFVLPSDTPRVDSTSNTVNFTLPGESAARTLELRPAQVSYGQPFAVLGSALSGDRVVLLIRRADWNAPLEVDAPWNAALSASRIDATAQASIGGVTLLPGLYAASVRVERRRTVPSGSRTLVSTSNETPFAIVPQLTAISTPNLQGQFTVDGAIFQHSDLATDSLSVFVGAERLTEVAGPALQPGEFTVTSATRLTVRLPAGLTPGAPSSLRLIIDGAESAPAWVNVP